MAKRRDYIGWEEYFMEVAKLSARRSKDPNTQVGTCIIGSDKKIVAVGYNGHVRGCDDDEYPWEAPEKYLYVCHAESNAILNSTNFSSLKGATLYSTLFPCNECTKLVIQVGIKEIVYLSDKYHEKEETVAARRMLDSAGIKYRNYENNCSNSI